MRWVKDKKGRFPKRPHFEPHEIDLDCEEKIKKYLKERYGCCSYPVQTEDLVRFLEQQVSDLDIYADLTPEGNEVWGLTDFPPGKKPLTKISGRLSESPIYENPYRFTLMHEYIHIWYHGPLFEFLTQTPGLFDASRAEGHSCKREAVEGKTNYAWMEWQANYGAGAILMPKRSLGRLALEFAKENRISAYPIGREESTGRSLIGRVSKKFGVSMAAGGVRLSMLGYVADNAMISDSLLT